MSITPSLKKNFAYKGLLTMATPVMGMVTFPYVSRVLGADNVGLVNFVDNTINYFLLFANMGISTLGIRSISSARGDKVDLSKTFSNILGLNLIFTLLVLVIYNLLISIVPRFNECSELFYIGNAKIIFSVLLIEWFYSGIENFKYITIRTLAIRLIYVISVFFLIKTSSDYKEYFLLTTSVVIINAIINLIHSRKFVHIHLKELVSFQFLQENVLLGIYAIMTSMYLTFNVMYLGLVSDNIAVGYYTSAYKLYHLILSVFTAFTGVMLPRMSSLVTQGDNEKFNYLINKSVEFVVLVSIPLIVCCSIMAPEIIGLLCGPGYDGAIVPMRIIMPAILAVGLAQILAIQILMPLKKDKVLLKASIAGAVMSLAINITLVPKLQSIGSALVLLFSELAVTVFYLAYAKKNELASIHLSSFIYPALKTVPCAIICLICQRLPSDVLSLSLAVIFSTIIYLILNTSQIKSLIHK